LNKKSLKVTLSSTGVIMTSVAADGKERKMYCIPFEFVFGWLFTINPVNVKEESREGLIKYQQECYYVLYERSIFKSIMVYV
jgi:hypothetical protein